MRIAMIGTGYVGLVTGVCFSEFGFHVTCVDSNARKVERLKKGEVPIYEIGLRLLMHNNQSVGRLEFTTDTAAAVADADVVFIAVGTPPRPEDGHADLRYVMQAAQDIAKGMNGYKVIVTKSTVPVGTGRQVADTIRKKNPHAEFDIASNPEFLREGSAVEDFMQPDRIVIGTDTPRAREIMERLYQPLVQQQDTPILVTGIESAEVIKYASNSFLATKIAFINEMADFCEAVGGDIEEVSRGMGMDKRIGHRFLQAGPGYGGACFPKDTSAMACMAEEAGSPLSLVEATIAANRHRKESMAGRITQAMGGNVADKTIGILGLTFKPGTDDMRESPSIPIIRTLLRREASLRLYDPKGMDAAREMFSDGQITWCKDAYHAAKGASALVVVTEWNEFYKLDLKKAGEVMETRHIIDLRNIYAPDEMKRHRFRYTPVGRVSI